MKKGDKYINKKTRRRVIISGISRIKGKEAIITFMFGRSLERWTARYWADFKSHYYKTVTN